MPPEEYIPLGQILHADRPKEPPTKVSILDEAARVVRGARNKDYGHPRDNHGRTAKLWSAYLADRGLQGELTAQDVCQLNILQKISRLQHSPEHRDSIVDIAGYAANVEMIHDP